MRSRPAQSLSFRVGWPFLLFIIVGSIGLTLWMQRTSQRESRAVFSALARSNAEFIHAAHLPASERMAQYLSQILNTPVFFRSPTGELAPQPAPELRPIAEALRQLPSERGAVAVGRSHEAIAAPTEHGSDLVLVRSAELPWVFLFQSETLLALGAFWLCSVALAWTVTRGVVRPLQLLTHRLPHIERDAETSLPGAERTDEIGQLARAYLDTRSQLATERERREKAERLALLGRMATGLAHEIHNPLSAKLTLKALSSFHA